jgi:hypothetical protein
MNDEKREKLALGQICEACCLIFPRRAGAAAQLCPSCGETMTSIDDRVAALVELAAAKR